MSASLVTTANISYTANSIVPLGIPGTWTPVFFDEFNSAISESNYRSYYGIDSATNAGLANVFSATDMATNANYGNLGADTGETGGIVPSMSFTSGGQLVVSANNISCTLANVSYAQRRGLVRTTQDYLYGAFETKIKLPAGNGLWPAFWLWPKAPGDHNDFTEIDILEAPSTAATGIYQNMHRWTNGTSVFQSGPDFKVLDGTQFHTFGCAWTASGGIQMYIDGVQTYSYTNLGNIPSVPLCVHFDFQVGGPWPGPVDGTTPWPSSMVAEYLRIWQ
jgi:beta-glucanase (GH16 family)